MKEDVRTSKPKQHAYNILCILLKYWCKLNHMKSYNCTLNFVYKFIKICSSMKVSLLYISIIYAFFFTYR